MSSSGVPSPCSSPRIRMSVPPSTRTTASNPPRWLLVHGYHDIQLPVAQMLRMANACQDAGVRILDAGHELPVEKPAELTATLDRFLTGCRV